MGLTILYEVNEKDACHAFAQGLVSGLTRCVTVTQWANGLGPGSCCLLTKSCGKMNAYIGGRVCRHPRPPNCLGAGCELSSWTLSTFAMLMLLRRKSPDTQHTRQARPQQALEHGPDQGRPTLFCPPPRGGPRSWSARKGHRSRFSKPRGL